MTGEDLELEIAEALAGAKYKAVFDRPFISVVLRGQDHDLSPPAGEEGGECWYWNVYGEDHRHYYGCKTAEQAIRVFLCKKTT